MDVKELLKPNKISASLTILINAPLFLPIIPFILKPNCRSCDAITGYYSAYEILFNLIGSGISIFISLAIFVFVTYLFSSYVVQKYKHKS
jgi:hypothetical protein